MINCQHEFIGVENAVICPLCGLRLSPDEYLSIVMGEKKTAENGSKTAKKRQPKKKEV